MLFKNMIYVYEVYKERSFSKAAKNLFISQPALSSAVKKVENELKIKIFDRSCNPIELTEIGEVYINSIEKIIKIENEFSNCVDSICRKKKKIIRIASTSYFCAYILPQFISSFEKENPDYELQLSELNPIEMSKALLSNNTDLCIGVEHIEADNIISKSWYEEEIILSVPSSFYSNNTLKNSSIQNDPSNPKKYDLLSGIPVSLKNFSNDPFIFLKIENDMYHRAHEMCRSNNFIPNIYIHVDQLLSSYHLSYNGYGISFVRNGLLNQIEPTDNLLFYKINDRNTKRKILFHYYESNYNLSTIKIFIDFLESVASLPLLQVSFFIATYIVKEFEKL